MSSKSKKLTTVLFALAAAVCMALALFFGIAPRTASAATVGENGVLAVTDADLKTEDGVITGLSEDAKAAIKEVASYTLTISGSATSIADEAFIGQTKLTSLTITSSSLKTIGEKAFADTTALTTITLNNELTTIGKSAFAMSRNTNNSALAEITIPENVTGIGELAFANRTRLSNIYFYATNCADFTVPATGVTNLDAASKNPFLGAGLQLMGNSGVTVYIGSTTTKPVTKIPAAMFMCSGTYNNKVTSVLFTNVNLGENAFGKYSFYGCGNLKEVDLDSGSVDSIGERAFSNCSSLSVVTLHSDLKVIGKDAFNGSALPAIIIPGSVTTIGDSAFRNCSALASVELGAVETISENAFYQCTALVSVTIPDSVKTIGRSAFEGCSRLRAANINNDDSQLTTVSQNAFYGCSSLTVITIPEKVTAIGDSAYAGCAAVTRINYYASGANDFPTTSNHPFSGVGSTGKGINVYIDSVKKIPAHMFYYTSSRLNVTSATLTNVEADISEDAFRNCVNLSSVTFGAGQERCTITNIGRNAFNGCQALTDFYLPDDVTSIGDGAFQNCKSILSITLPAKLETIGNNAFNGCERLFVVIDLAGLGLKPGDTTNGGVAANAVSVSTDANDAMITDGGLHFIKIKDTNNNDKYYLIGAISTLNGEVELPAYVPTLGTNTVYDIYQYAFQNHNQITKIIIPATVGVIKEYAFSQCAALTEVEIKDGVKEIGSHAFAGCTALTTVTLPKGLDIIASELFQNCTSLKNVEIPASVTSIGSYSFNNTGLTSVEIPASVQSISVSAFEGCKALASVTFLDNEGKYSLTNIGYGAFQNCSSLVYIVLPETVTALDGEAFSGASKLTTVYLPTRLTSYGKDVFSGCSDNLVIISSKDTYSNNYELLGSDDRLTYMVDVELVYGDATHIVKKLYNFDYSYELQSNEITWLTTAKKLPVMEGYSSSIWYDNKEYTGDALTEDDITGLLKGEKTIKLYAYYVAKPTYVLKTLNYTDFANEVLVINGGNLDEINERLFEGAPLGEQLVLELVEYRNFKGDTKTGINDIKEAGYYTIKITLIGSYGEWDEPYLLTITVEREIVNISDPDELNWVVNTGDGTSPLNSERLWLPASGEGDPYIANPEGSMPDGYREELVEYSVLHYSAVTWMLELTDVSRVKYDIEYIDTIGREVGIYTASAVITPTNNYTLQTGAFQYGMSCAPYNAADGSYIVSKVWYVVAIANTLWVPGTSEKYHIDGWTYNEENIENKIPKAPALSYGNELASALVNFSLSLEVDGVKKDIVSGERYNEFSSWINKSMPAGNYTLTVNVQSPDLEIADMHEVYEFTVQKAKLDAGIAAGLVSDINAKLNGKKLTYAYNGLAQIGYEEIEAIITSLNEHALNPNRDNTFTNNWWSSEYNDYYGPFSIGYNISTMNSNAYLSADEIANSQYAAIGAGAYTVYYQLSAPNYELLVKSVDNKFDYHFDLVIYEQINVSRLAQAGGYTYTGSVIIPFTNNEMYQVISLEAGEFLGNQDEPIRNLVLTVPDRNYTDVGTPKIVLKITNPSIYQWQKAANVDCEIFGDNDEYLLLSFNIVRCDNATTQALDIIRWSWGSYSASVNKPIWSTRFVTEYTFTLTSTTSRVYQQDEFGNAPAGQYTLTARAAGGAGYNWEPFTATTTINILKADNYWDVVPSVYDWAYGEYTTRVVGPAAKPHFGDASAIVTSYYKLNADGAVEGQGYDSLDKLRVDGEVPVGQYLMRVQLAGNSNYNTMAVTDVYFRVSQAYNSWIEVPYVIGWSEGHFDGLENGLNKGNSKFGEVIITVTDSQGNVIDVNNFSKLSVGNYTVTAYVEGTENYYAMQPITTTFAVVEDSVSMTGLIAATMVFAVLAVGLAVAAVVLLILRSRKIEAEFRKMIKKELGRK